ncbi:thioesterase II family protein [Streptomyces sp. NBC_01014]|uniref:thioesterase II family protein n=1 Tax=Streptomyces sp. NBC_01014 TaxID=2903719 RepID=UPI003865771F|nr:alpha/beta fold hydrolase [Streptomyces sp. NBC_01014]
MTAPAGAASAPDGPGPPHTTSPSGLFHRPLPRPHAALRLVCLPHAGGGTSVFRDWPARLPADVELVAVRLPGRESRIRERPFTSWTMLVDVVADALAREVPAPYVLFGHSLGGMLAYELTMRGASTAPPSGAAPPAPQLPERLILAGCRAPDVPSPHPGLHDVPRDRFAADLAALAGSPPEVLRNRALLGLLEPMLRADLELAQTWPWREPLPLPVPLTVFDASDDVMAPPEAVAGWRRYAPLGVRAHHLSGGHFTLHEDPERFLTLLRGELLPAAGRVPTR